MSEWIDQLTDQWAQLAVRLTIVLIAIFILSLLRMLSGLLITRNSEFVQLLMFLLFI